MKNSKIYVIVAVSEHNGIGKNGVMPWSFHKETEHFKKITLEVSSPDQKNAVVMGRTTWYSLPEKFRPLKDRENIVLTFEKDDQIPMEQKFSLEEAIADLKNNPQIDKIFIIGGASVYRYSLEKIDLDGIYLTKIAKNYDCDTFFPEIPSKYSQIQKLGETIEQGVQIDFLLYSK